MGGNALPSAHPRSLGEHMFVQSDSLADLPLELIEREQVRGGAGAL
jgi:hypothetical protein